MLGPHGKTVCEADLQLQFVHYFLCRQNILTIEIVILQSMHKGCFVSKDLDQAIRQDRGNTEKMTKNITLGHRLAPKVVL